MVKEINKPIYVVDTETTGLTGYPKDLIVELGIYRINEDLSIDHIYDTLISYPKQQEKKINKSWWSDKSGVKFDNLQGYPDLKTVWTKIKQILDGKRVLSWNMSYDFEKFFDKMIRAGLPKINYSKLNCPMEVSTDIVQVEWLDWKQSWKWPQLPEASKFYDIFLDSDGYGFHRADYDTHVTSLVVVEMIRRGDYPL